MIEVKKAAGQEELDSIHRIRRKVFIEEQNCPPELEWESEDECVHFLAMLNGEPAGTARWWPTPKGIKLQRFAVLKEYRGIGVGQALVKAVLDDLPSGTNYVYLHAQIQACSLYEKFGFKKEGPEFDEVGIRHFKMVLRPGEKS
ncbi:MAG: GNAT family N-acetyltransferase [Sphingobacteriaceae bacterium]|nr:GNAT family N-acetyltransferase [Sphingobacteriaceae bacterium]